MRSEFCLNYKQLVCIVSRNDSGVCCVMLFCWCQAPNVLEEVDLVEMGITNATHRLTILQAASKRCPVLQTGCV